MNIGDAHSDPLFAGGGEMGRVMAARDWAATPLGPPQTWPASLRSAVRILLTSRFAMWLGWGPNLAFFYNDAYRRDTLRTKHPWALGQPASAVWAEIWDEVGPRIASVLHSGRATWDEDLLLFLERSGYPEETYHTFSYSPLSDDDGTVAGMLCVVTEVTDRVLSERRMATLRELATDLGAAHGERQVLDAVARRVGENPRDLPWTLTYLFDGGSGAITATLSATSGIAPGEPAAPHRLGPDSAGGWPVADLHAGRTVLVDDLRTRFPRLPAGAWPEPPSQAVAVPLAQLGQARPVGFLVAALNPFRTYDDRYQGFVELLAGQIATGLGNARAYEAERRRAEGLAELDRAKTEFFTGISHEFRTPLTLIMGPVQELRDSPVVQADDRLRTELEVVHRNGQRLGKLVNALLDFSRLQAGRIQARFEPVDLPALTAELASVFRSAMQRAGLTFTVDCPALPAPVHVDRDMWEKIVLNLLSNALKFTFDGEVVVAVRRVGAAAELIVRDTGTGIPAAELPHLFERFHRVPQARARSGEGSGIGLATVRALVALHGGSVEVRSAPDAGTTFTVTVPLGRGHLPAEQVADGPATGSGISEAAEPFLTEALRWLPSDGFLADSATAKAGRVLVADDNADMREYLHRLLSDRYRVELTTDGHAALAAALADPPDLVVSDVMMPGLDGMELLAALRGDARTSRVPVLLLSARAGQEAAVEGLAAGADDYLVKPFAAAELLARVDGHVRLGRSRGEAERQFRTLADATPALVWADGPGAHRIFVNQAWRQFVGAADPDPDLGLRWRERIHPDDRARYDKVRAAHTDSGFEVEYRLRGGDGRYRWVLDRGAPVGGGGHVGGCLDVDTRHRERERQRLLAIVGVALDRETGLDARRDALVRSLVDEGLVDAVRLVAFDDTPRVVAVASRTPPAESLMRELAADWPMAREVLATGQAMLFDVDPDYLARSSAGAHDLEVRRRLDMRSVVLVPLSTRGRVVGVLATARTGDSPAQTVDDLTLLVDIGERAATALDNAALYEREQATSRRLALLQQATAALSAAATPEQVAEVAVTEFQKLVGTPAVGVWELHPTTLEAVDIGGWRDPVRQEWTSFPLDAPVAATEAVRRRTPVWVQTDADWAPYRPVQQLAAGYGYASVDVLPLLTGGNCLGVVIIGFDRERVLDPTEQATAVALADQCAQAYQRATLLARESAARRAAEEFADVVSALSGATTPAEVTAVMLRHAAELGAEAAAVLIRDGDQLAVLASTGVPGLAADRRLGPAAAHPIAHAVRTGDAVWHDTRTAPAWQDQHFSADGVDLPAQVVLPLRLGGTTTGAIGMRFGARAPVFSADRRATVATIIGQCAQALDRARLHQAEHEVAEVLQRSLLPGKLPPLARLGTAVHYQPGATGSQTGGDWYDLLPLPDHRAALVVGDVVGQGPAAAAVMGQLRSALAGYLLEGHPPAAALELLDVFAGRVPGAQGSTCACVVVDWAGGELRWARAGHPPVLLVDSGGARFLDGGTGTVLGVSGRPPYVEARVAVAPGASVVLYTDGLIERRGEVLDDGLQRLLDATADAADADPAQLVSTLLVAAVADRSTHDDIAVIAARLMPAPLQQRLPAQPTTLPVVRRAVRAWAATAALGEDLLDDLQLALGEATANAVEHAYRADAPNPGYGVARTAGDGAARNLDVDDGVPRAAPEPEFEYGVARTADGGVQVHVRDFGTWRPPPEDPGHRGRGVALVRHLAAECSVEPGPSGTTVGFTLAAPRAVPPTGRPGSTERQARQPAAPGHPATLHLRAEAEGRTRAELRGDIDLPAALTLRDELLTCLARLAPPRPSVQPDTAGRGAPILVVDVAAVTYLASAGVGLLLELADRARACGVDLHVHYPPDGIAARVLELTGLTFATTSADGAPGRIAT